MTPARTLTIIAGQMRRRRPAYVAAAVLAAALLVSGPAESQTPAASIVASDNAFKTASGDPANVTIAPGGRVDFAYPTGSNAHNVVFTGNAPPTSCTTTAGPAATNEALPAMPSTQGWAGHCEFGTFGT